MATPTTAVTSGEGKTPYPGGSWEPGRPPYGVGAPEQTDVVMSDGVRLSATLTYPTRQDGARPEATFPVLLRQDPYGGAPDGDRDFFVAHGYIYVDVDVRGHGRSGGQRDYLSRRMGRDGAELVEWSSTIDGASGTVGLTGCSYLGAIQLITAAEVGPDSPLKAIAPFCIDSDPFRDLAANGGIPTGFFPYLDGGLVPGPEVDEQYDEVSVTVAELLSGGPRSYDSPYWRDRSGTELMSKIVENSIPALTQVGWFDIFPGGNLEMYAAAQNACAGRPLYAPMERGQQVTGRYQAIVGPWGHGEATSGERLRDLKLQWFETWLKGVDTGMEDTDHPLHLFLNGRQQWVDAAAYPITRTPTTFHLGDQTLGTGEPGPDAVRPARLRWGAATEGNLLTYTSEPMPDSQVIAGPSALTVHVSANTADVMLTAKLSIVRPDGSVQDISVDGALIGSQRALDESRTWYGPGGELLRPYHHLTAESARPITPGLVERLDISLLPTVTELGRGDRLRLTIASLPPEGYHMQLAPTTEQVAALEGGEYTIHSSPEARSALRVPLVPVGSLPESAVPWGPASADETGEAAATAAQR